MTNRTGIHIAVIAVRSSIDNFMKPLVYTTSSDIDECFYMLYKQSLSQYSLQLEAYCIAGLKGMFIFIYLLTATNYHITKVLVDVYKRMPSPLEAAVWPYFERSSVSCSFSFLRCPV